MDWHAVRAAIARLTGWTLAEIRTLPQGACLRLLDELERQDTQRLIRLAGFIGLTVGGDPEGVLQETWLATLSEDEREAYYETRRAEAARLADPDVRRGR